MNDTVLAINKEQLVKINRSLNDYLHIKTLNKSLIKELSLSDSICYYWKSVAAKSDTMYLLKSKQFEEAYKSNLSLEKSLSEEKKKTIKVGFGVGLGGTLLGILLGVLIK